VLKFLKYGNTLYGDLFPSNFYVHMIFTLDVDFKPNPHKMLLHCAKTYKVYERLQKEKNDTLRKTEQKYRKDQRQTKLFMFSLLRNDFITEK